MVTVLMPGQSDETACVRISAALSEVTKQKLGFSVSIEQVAPTNYSEELWKRMVCQTMPDLFFLTENQPLDVYLNQGVCERNSCRQTYFGTWLELRYNPT